MPAVCYILYSRRIDKFYIGATHDVVDQRVEKHNYGFYDDKWTAQGIPWILFHSIECTSITQAMRIERHIKNMKSKKYIQNLKAHPEISEKLKERYPD